MSVVIAAILYVAKNPDARIATGWLAGGPLLNGLNPRHKLDFCMPTIEVHQREPPPLGRSTNRSESRGELNLSLPLVCRRADIRIFEANAL